MPLIPRQPPWKQSSLGMTKCGMPWPLCSGSPRGQCRACSCAKTILSATRPHSFCPPSGKCKLPKEWLGLDQQYPPHQIASFSVPCHSSPRCHNAVVASPPALDRPLHLSLADWPCPGRSPTHSAVRLALGWVRRDGQIVSGISGQKRIYCGESAGNGTDNGQPMPFQLRPLQWHRGTRQNNQKQHKTTTAAAAMRG